MLLREAFGYGLCLLVSPDEDRHIRISHAGLAEHLYLSVKRGLRFRIEHVGFCIVQRYAYVAIGRFSRANLRNIGIDVLQQVRSGVRFIRFQSIQHLRGRRKKSVIKVYDVLPATIIFTQTIYACRRVFFFDVL